MLTKIRAFLSRVSAKPTTLILLLIIVAAIPLAVWMALTSQEGRQRASGNPATPPNPNAPTVNIAFSPTSFSQTPNQTSTITMMLEAGTINIGGVDITIQYPKDFLQILNFVPSTSFNNNVINTTDTTAGTIHFATTNTLTTHVTGNIPLGTIQFNVQSQPSNAVNANVAVNLIASQIVAEGYAGVALNITSNPVTYAIIYPSVTPLPTGVPTATPTLIPTIIPSSIPTPTPVPGNIDDNPELDIRDYNIWVSEFLNVVGTKKSDLNHDNKIDLLDFSIWRDAFLNSFTPTPTPIAVSKRVFVTQALFNGNLGGVSGADAKCQTIANNTSFGGTWKAWLSDSVTSASSRFTHNNTFYKLGTNGSNIASNWSDLTDGNLSTRIDKTEIGSFLDLVHGQQLVWTNSNILGNVDKSDPNLNCSNWTSSASTISGSAGEISSSSTWTNGFVNPCSASWHLYCFEQ